MLILASDVTSGPCVRASQLLAIPMHVIPARPTLPGFMTFTMIQRQLIVLSRLHAGHCAVKLLRSPHTECCSEEARTAIEPLEYRYWTGT